MTTKKIHALLDSHQNLIRDTLRNGVKESYIHDNFFLEMDNHKAMLSNADKAGRDFLNKLGNDSNSFVNKIDIKSESSDYNIPSDIYKKMCIIRFHYMTMCNLSDSILTESQQAKIKNSFKKKILKFYNEDQVSRCIIS